MNTKEFISIRSMIEIAHHVPGRLRLRIDPEIRKHPAAAELGKLRSNEFGILSTRLNPLARSLVVEYDTAKINPAVLEEFLVSKDNARVAELAEQFANVFGVTPQ